MSRPALERRPAVAWVCLAALASAISVQGVAAQPVPLPTEPLCAPAARPTPPQTEGPYYKPNPPQRHDLASTRPAGERIVLTGFVLTRDCRPIPGAVVDLWQADASGAYDNTGYDLRGYALTDARGRYWFEIVVPARYPGRTPHIHVKVLAPGQQTPLTTQLYFPNEQRNAGDRIFNPALLLNIRQVRASQREEPLLVGRYDFVLDTP
ncbi:dioxygenase family protein [Microvirga roseola]|uniref:dioxygenase family protein n=1 Tax=Microvirga roseola TaxID=2883126 RepID=UPI001E2F0CB9|nr:intradiol ring-cleavage dioxygenase [Microvirga roseola]